MNMKTRLDKLARKTKESASAECSCPGVKMTIGLAYTGKPPPKQEVCSQCNRKIPQEVIKVVYDEPPKWQETH